MSFRLAYIVAAVLTGFFAIGGIFGLIFSLIISNSLKSLTSHSIGSIDTFFTFSLIVSVVTFIIYVVLCIGYILAAVHDKDNRSLRYSTLTILLAFILPTVLLFILQIVSSDTNPTHLLWGSSVLSLGLWTVTIILQQKGLWQKDVQTSTLRGPQKPGLFN